MNFLTRELCDECKRQNQFQQIARNVQRQQQVMGLATRVLIPYSPKKHGEKPSTIKSAGICLTKILSPMALLSRARASLAKVDGLLNRLSPRRQWGTRFCHQRSRLRHRLWAFSARHLIPVLSKILLRQLSTRLRTTKPGGSKTNHRRAEQKPTCKTISCPQCGCSLPTGQ